MKKIPALLILVFIAGDLFSQSHKEHYKFLEDIYAQIKSDTTEWKYQSGATQLSFSGYYSEVLKVWDKNGFKESKTTVEDSLYFVKSKVKDAKEYIINKSRDARIVIINEAHHIPAHRTFTRSLLQGLYDNGYRYLGLEALFDTTINQRKYPVLESGYYTKEPEFGNLIYEAIKIGFTLFGYEASQGKNGTEREIEQAANIQKFIENNPNGKVLIHCGYAHAFENEYPAWGKAMAGRLKDNMKIDPLTIDQTMFPERHEKQKNSIFIKLNNKPTPIVLVDENEQVFNGKNNPKQVDIVIIHPATKLIDGRPHWLTINKQKHTVDISKTHNNLPILVIAYRKNEFENNGVPTDSIEITDKNSLKNLYLSKGLHEIIIKDKNYNILNRYYINIE